MNTYLNNIEFYLPEKSLSNLDISIAHPEWSIEKIAKKTGILNRHISAKDEFVSDMAIKSCNKLFQKNPNISKDSIDYIILCTQSPDYFLPTTSCIIQDKLKLKNSIGSIDINQGCSGFVYSLGLAKGLINSGQVNTVLIITSETYSKYINPLDKSNKTLFGDAAASILVSNISEGLNYEIQNFKYGTDGSGFENLIVKNGGMRNKSLKSENVFEEDNFVRNDNNLFMDGRAVFEFTLNVVPKLVEDVLEKNNLNIDQIDKFVFHQANKFIIDKIRQKLKVDEDKFIFNSEFCGNTVSSTIPISLKKLFDSYNFSKGEKIMICGFGVGLSYSGSIIEKK